MTGCQWANAKTSVIVKRKCERTAQPARLCPPWRGGGEISGLGLAALGFRGQTMRVLFNDLELIANFPPAHPLSAAEQMALDEGLLLAAVRPILRVYRWACPAVSFGYFDPWQEVMARLTPLKALTTNGLTQNPTDTLDTPEMVRRWTGGGIVHHGEDVTYALMVPRGCPFAKMPALESYAAVHQAIQGILAADGLVPELAPTASESISRACFENPARYDLIVAGHKVAGAAQRRSRHGLLHQGSLQGSFRTAAKPGKEGDDANAGSATNANALEATATFAERLAHAFSTSVQHRELYADELRRATELALVKYATEAWTKRV